MGLGVAGDADVRERAAQLVQVLQQVERGVVVPGRRVGVAGRHEDAAHAGRRQTGAQISASSLRPEIIRAARCGTTS